MNRVTFAYLCRYVCTCKRRNKSGTTSVVVVDKSSGRFKELTTIGVASTSEEIAELEVKAQRWIDHYGGQQTFDFEESEKGYGGDTPNDIHD